jgi:hypothetical protein
MGSRPARRDDVMDGSVNSRGAERKFRTDSIPADEFAVED